jgi:hypothetical protein
MARWFDRRGNTAISANARFEQGRAENGILKAGKSEGVNGALWILREADLRAWPAGFGGKMPRDGERSLPGQQQGGDKREDALARRVHGCDSRAHLMARSFSNSSSDTLNSSVEVFLREKAIHNWPACSMACG